MEAATACVFLLLRFVSASASSLCRFLSRALDLPPPAPTPSPASRCYTTAGFPPSFVMRKTAPKDQRNATNSVGKIHKNHFWLPSSPLTSSPFFCCPMRTRCSLLAAHSSAARTAAFSSVKKRLFGGSSVARACDHTHFIPPPCRSKPVGTDSVHVAREREHVCVY